MLTAGVDLAAESTGTALAVIRWSKSAAVLGSLHLGVDDSHIVAAAADVDKLGIDCAFGWPDEFVAFVRAHADFSGPPVDGGMDWRRTLAYRETDREVRRQSGRWPLSVSTDRLGLTAMRCAGLLGRLEAAGHVIDRAGEGLAVEVYPGASLRMWGLVTTGYRTEPERRSALLDAILDETPWFDVAGFAPLMTASADAFDAVVAALAARGAALGAYDPPDPAQEDRARREGWIALPTGRLAALVHTA